MNAKEIFDKLVDRAWFYASGLSNRGRGKPGELVSRLSDEEREELKNLSSKDIQVPERNLMYIQGQYGDNNVTVHKLFPNKKEKEEENE